MRTPRLLIVVGLLLASCTSGELPCRPASHYAPPANAPYVAEEVRIPTMEGHVLVGTLTRPKGSGGRPPAVVLIGGSHGQDRDMAGAAVGPLSHYRPFRQVADTLSRRGFAVLRVDDRSVGCSGGGPLSDASTDIRAEDTRATIGFLRGHDKVDGRRLGLLGISEGATIAVMIGATDHALRGIVSMAGHAGPGWRVWKHQTRYLISLGEEMDRAKKTRWLAGEDPEVILEERVAEARAHVAAGEANPWWTFFFIYDPTAVAPNIVSPVLILHGARDSNVPVADADRLAQAIRSGGNPDVTVRIFTDHNHLFLPDRHGGFRRYAELLQRTNQIPEEVLTTIADWFSERMPVADQAR